MGDRGYHFPHRHHARDMRQFRLRFAQCLFRLLALGDVAGNEDKCEGVADKISCHGAHNIQGEDLTLLGAVIRLVLTHYASVSQRLECFLPKEVT